MKIVTAPKGRRGCMSYVDYAAEGEVIPELTPPKTMVTSEPPKAPTPKLTSTLAARPQVYIPSAHYIQSARTNLAPRRSNLQVIAAGDYGGGEILASFEGQGSSTNRPGSVTPAILPPVPVLPQQGQGQLLEQQPVPTFQVVEATSNLTESQVIGYPVQTVHPETLTETESIAMDIMGLFNEPQNTK